MGALMAEIKTKVILLVGDTVAEETVGSAYQSLSGTQTPGEVLVDAINAALFAVSSRVWKPAVLEVEEAVTSVDLPDDLIDVEGIRDLETGLLLPSIPLQVSRMFDDGWTLFPYRKVTFSSEKPKGVLIYYSGMWAHPDYDVSEIDAYEFDFPLSLTNAVTFYAAAYCYLQKAGQHASVRQYNTKVDSGDPLDNPSLSLASALMKQFEEELKRFPQSVKGTTF